MCYGSVGTDTGGSIRIPAAACGVVGLKPTHGEISADGVVPLSATLDHVGPLALHVGDAALLFHAMLDGDAATDRAPAGRRGTALARRARAVFPRQAGRRRRAAVRGGARGADERAGTPCRDVSVAHAERTADVYLHIVLPEASWYHAPLLAAHADKYSPGVRLRLEMGRYVLAEDYLRAMHARAVLRRAVDKALEGLDALLLPALAIGAPPIGAGVGHDRRQRPSPSAR